MLELANVVTRDAYLTREINHVIPARVSEEPGNATVFPVRESYSAIFTPVRKPLRKLWSNGSTITPMWPRQR